MHRLQEYSTSSRTLVLIIVSYASKYPIGTSRRSSQIFRGANTTTVFRNWRVRWLAFRSSSARICNLIYDAKAAGSKYPDRFHYAYNWRVELLSSNERLQVIVVEESIRGSHID